MEASTEQTAEGLAIIRVLATVLDRLVLANSPIARADPGLVTKFHAMKVPGIAMQQYLERCVDGANVIAKDDSILFCLRSRLFVGSDDTAFTDMRHVQMSASFLHSYTSTGLFSVTSSC